jgi:predicted ArsR family transcriptional regulator
MQEYAGTVEGERMATNDEALAALSTPTRLAIVRHVAANCPSEVTAIARALQVDESTVRRQLPELVTAGLLTEQRQRTGRRGRPAMRYVPGPAADALLAGGAIEAVACMLADVISNDDDPIVVGRRYASTDLTLEEDPVAAVAAVADELERHGFAPERVRRGRRREIVLHECPFARVAERAPSIVCALHLGLIEGTAAAVGAPAVAGLHPKAPHKAGCRVVFRPGDATAQ